MSLYARIAILVVGLFAGSACKHTDPYYCPGATLNNCVDVDAAVVPVDSFIGCTGDPSCSGATPVCDLVSKKCVACVGSDDQECVGTTPVCGSDDTCHACAAHADCASAACLPDGSCASAADVAYVDPGGTDNTTCSHAMPCTKVAKALGTGLPYVKFHGTTNEAVTITSQAVTFLADPGAVLTRSDNGIILTLMGSTNLAIYDLSITGASGTTTGIGISVPAATSAMLALTRATVANCQDIGISVASGILTVNQSTIFGNTGGGISLTGSGPLTIEQSIISGNTGGGISLTGSSFKIENTFIVKNGSPSSVFGGVQLSSLTAGGSYKLDFDTIAQNGGLSMVDSGIQCNSVFTPLTFSDSVIYGNTVSSGGTQVGGSANCLYTYSDIGPDTVTGTGNINADPLFVDPTNNNFRIKVGSPCIDAADPAATIAVDFDGTSRPQGARDDIGAFEYKP